VTYNERDVLEFMATGLRTSTSEPNRECEEIQARASAAPLPLA
jgi:hypothetical protein